LQAFGAELQLQACLNAFEKAFEQALPEALLEALLEANPFHNRDERHTLLLLVRGAFLPTVLSGPLPSAPFLRPTSALPHPAQFLRAGRRLNRIQNSTKQFVVLDLTDFRHQLQAFGAELQCQACLDAFEQAFELALLDEDPFHNRD